jgi:DNA invertase Pin-like site-specific DNA recombinase
MDIVYLRVDTLKQELDDISDNFKKQIEEYKADILK